MTQKPELPVVAAIPNHNMAKSLAKLLPQVIAQRYHEIFVLDDASTDTSRQVVNQYTSIRLIRGQEQVGPGANRNRILDHLDYDAIIHFIDADVSLESTNNVKQAQDLFQDPGLGLVGGLIKLPDGTPWFFNYGPRYSLYSILAGSLQLKLRGKGHHLPIIKYFLKELPDVTKQPEAKEVFWVGEANMLVASKVFRKVGGFNPKLWYHEIQDLSKKIETEGLKAWFEPSISVMHPHFDLKKMTHKARRSKASRHLIRKYGLPLK